jgi:hypothetical protein
MDSRIPIALTLGLVLLAFGGFYFALSPRAPDVVAPPPPMASAPAPIASEREAPSVPAPAPSSPAARPAPTAPAGSVAAVPVAPPNVAARATPASIEAEIANSENAELQTLLKANFSAEYNELMVLAARRRNEGIDSEQFGQELFSHLQDMLRAKLKFAVGAGMPTIDKLAANETKLFHTLGTEAADFCLRLLGKDDTPATALPPANVREMMRLGTLYRFQAIVEGMPNSQPFAVLTPDDMKAFEASLGQDGMKFDEVRTGAFLAKGGPEPGKPCLMLEKLYVAIARLPADARRKIYAGMFFLGRDK